VRADGAGGGGEGQESSSFLKKEPKNFSDLAPGSWNGRWYREWMKVFLLLFLQKKKTLST
jgi:hypothetical protein